MKNSKIIFIACFITGLVACGGSKQNTSSGKENTSTVMDSGAKTTPPMPDSTKHQ